MNNTFELKRFGLVFKKLLFERSLSLWGAFILFAFVTWMIFPVPNDNNVPHDWLNSRLNQFGSLIILGGIYWVSIGLSYFSNKDEGTNYLLLPASYFEKWLSVVILFCIFSALYFTFYRALDTAYLSYYRHQLDTKSKSYWDLYNAAQLMPFWGDSKARSYSLFFTITGMIAIGSLYFNRMAIVKTLLLFVGFNIVFFYFHDKINDFIFQTPTSTGLKLQSITVGVTGEIVTLPSPFLEIYSFMSDYFYAFIFWLIALVRMREKEI
jgi:hypothetical protein